MNKIASGLISIFLGFYFLVIGKPLLIPLIWAVVISFFIIEIADAYKSIKIGNLKMPGWLSMILSISTIGFVMWFLISVINNNIHEVIKVAPSYQEKFYSLIGPIKSNPYVQQIELDKALKSLDFANILSNVAMLVKNITGNVALIFFYVLFILLENRYFNIKIEYIFQKNKIFSDCSSKEVIQNIKKDVKMYVLIKSAVSFFTAVLSYAVLKFYNVEFAALWAMLIFLLNYIPTVGSIVAVAFPAIMSTIQFYDQPNGLVSIVIVVSFLVAIQVIMGNIIEPKLAGDKLNLSPLVIMISLVLWNSIWGISGMFLCVPITVIINIIFSNIESTKSIAVLLSAKGKIVSNGQIAQI